MTELVLFFFSKSVNRPPPLYGVRLSDELISFLALGSGYLHLQTFEIREYFDRRGTEQPHELRCAYVS